MAVTSLWRIDGSLNALLSYVKNPEKTVHDSLLSVLDYATSDTKTTAKLDDESLPVIRQLVYGINCNASTAIDEMLTAKRKFGKEGGTVAYHGYQSFAPGEATPEMAHEIGIKLAHELWGEKYQVVVATHLDRENHLHSHFVINTVSLKDGIRFHRTAKDYYRMQEASDRLCREYGLSVITDKRGRRKNYAEHIAERNGEPTLRSQIRSDIDKAISASTTEYQFLNALKSMGYELKFTGSSGAELKYPALKPNGAKGFFRFHKLAAGYDYDSLLNRVYNNFRIECPFPAEKSKKVYRYKGTFKPYKKQTGFKALYFYYCYKLRIIRKHPESQRRVHFYMREDITKLEKLNEETKFIARTGIDTMPQLDEYKASIERQLHSLTGERDDMRKQSRKGNESAHDRVLEISEELKNLRKELSLCHRIEERSLRIETVLKDREQEMEEKQNEHIRRSGRSGRENDTQWR